MSISGKALPAIGRSFAERKEVDYLDCFIELSIQKWRETSGQSFRNEIADLF